jgi:RNA polymerase sigma-70 factor (ECF subfamily)
MTEDDTRRLAKLFDSHADRLFRLARRLVTTPDDARDLVQDTFVKAARSLRSLPAGASAEEAWLVRVMVNIRRDDWRKARVRKRAAPSLMPDPGQRSAVESSFDTQRAVWAALDRLAPRRRAALVMHELEGLDVRAIARALSVTELTVRWHLSMARRDLKILLRPFMEVQK